MAGPGHLPGEDLEAPGDGEDGDRFGLAEKNYTNSGCRWHVVAFRAARDGNLKAPRPRGGRTAAFETARGAFPRARARGARARP